MSRTGIRMVGAIVVLVVAAAMSIAAGGPASASEGSAVVEGAPAESGGPPEAVSCSVTVNSAAGLTTANNQPGDALYTVCVAAGAAITPTGGDLLWTRPNSIIAGLGSDASQARITGRITVAADHVTIRDLVVTHPTGTVRLWADHVSLLNSTVRAPRGTCVEVGYLDGYRPEGLPPDAPGFDYNGYHKVFDVVISGNTIGGCADDPVFLDTWTCNNSGYPGIYSQWVDGLQISENVITSTALRGIQLFPFNRNVTVTNNLLRKNSIAMNIGTSDFPYPQAANISVSGNVFDHQWSSELVADHPHMQSSCIPNERPFTDYLGSNSPPHVVIADEATGNNPWTTVDASVQVTGNCGTEVEPEAGTSFIWNENLAETATFASSSDHHQLTGSKCATFGPTRLRPVGGNRAPDLIDIDAMPTPDAAVGPDRRTVTSRRVFIYIWARDDNQASNTLQARIANGTEAYSTWRPVSPSLPWTLSASSSTQARTLRVQVRDSSNLVSNEVSRTITYIPQHDLSGDSFADLLVRRTSDQQMRLYRGNSSSSLSTPTVSMTGSWAIFDKVIVTPDFDGDSVPDVIARIRPGRADSGQLRLYPGNNAGGFGAYRTIGTGWSSYPTIVAPGDFDGDGLSDVLAVSSAGALYLYPGRASGFGTRRQIGTQTYFGSYTFYTPGDFDGDWLVDVLLRRNSDGAMILASGNGTGGFKGTFPQVGSGWSNITAVGTGDMNHDGFADLMARKANGTLWVYRGNGTGAFNGSYQIGSSTTWGSFDPLA